VEYNVVFENDSSWRGGYGIRSWNSYLSQQDFADSQINRAGQKIIALGVTEEEARDLCCLTPEICRLIGAVEEAYTFNSDPNSTQLELQLYKARFAIMKDRQRIVELGLGSKKYDAMKYIKFFTKLLDDQGLNVKTATMIALLANVVNIYGQVNL